MSPSGSSLNVMTIRSAFYTPVIACATRFAREEGISANLQFVQGHNVAALLKEGRIDIAQSAPSNSMVALARGDADPIVHVAIINDRDGFYIVGREPRPDFEWKDLEGATLVPASFAFQPEACLRFCLMQQGVDWSEVKVVRGLNGMDEARDAFRKGTGDFVHLQDPLARQLVHEGSGNIVASVGEALGPIAFSSLATTRDLIRGRRDDLLSFLRSYHRTQQWIAASAAGEIVDTIQAHFADVDRSVLVEAIEGYKGLGTWPTSPVIPLASYERAVDMVMASPDLTGVTMRYAYAQCCDDVPAREASAR